MTLNHHYHNNLTGPEYGTVFKIEAMVATAGIEIDLDLVWYNREIGQILVICIVATYLRANANVANRNHII